MTRIVAPEEFVSAFDAVIRRRQVEVAALWWEAKKYSELFLDRETGILPEVATVLGLSYWSEYFKIDAVFYEELDNVHFRPDWNVARSLAVAVEHENIGTSSPYEASKLSLFNVPLKVLITYPGRSQEESLLSSYADILRAADVFHDFASLRRQIVVFGWKDNDRVTWRYHVFTDHGFGALGP